MTTTRRNFLNTTAALTGAAVLSAGQARTQDAQWDGGLDWPADQALPRFAEPIHLDAADITHLSGDQQATLVTLQGIVNRRRPRLYWILSGDQTDQTWLGTIDVPNTVASDPWSLFAKYRREIRGAIVYDSKVPDTINVATSLAGLHDAVIATPELASSLKLPILEDLRGRFPDKLAAYRWLLEKHWPGLTHRIVTAIGPSNTVHVSGVQWATLLQVSEHVHDASNKATYPADLSSLLTGGSGTIYVRYQDAYSNEGWGP
ncbi:MAG: twin-arginine translocation signal domain-containing protein, partial [Acidobacteriota bacterium]|nr:twin-arginine translocation signal domain-containing protein [Acidobacteriota bacterium]